MFCVGGGGEPPARPYSDLELAVDIALRGCFRDVLFGGVIQRFFRRHFAGANQRQPIAEGDAHQGCGRV